MNRSVKILAIAAAAAGLAFPAWSQPTFLSELPEANFFSAAELQSLRGALGTDEGDVIREAYDVVVERLQASGHDVAIELSSFHTYYPEEFSSHTLAELWDLPEGEYLDVDRLTLSGEEHLSPHVHFLAEWKRYEFREGVSQVAALTLAQALELQKEVDPESPETSAVTAFQVTLSFDGKDRTYRAGVSWGVEESGEVRLRFNDPVLPGAHKVLETEEPITRHQDLDMLWEEVAPESFHGGDGASADGTQCAPESWNVGGNFLELGDAAGHKDGEHFGRMWMNARCSCSRSCIARCVPSFRQRSCNDFGKITNILLAHQTSDDFGIAANTGYRSISCGASLGCAVRSCLLGLFCEVEFGVARSPGFISFRALGTKLRDLSVSDGAQCFCHDDSPDHPEDCDRDFGEH